MKKSILFTVLHLCLLNALIAQQNQLANSTSSSNGSGNLSFHKNAKIISAGIGIAGNYFGSGSTSKISLFLTGEKAITENIGLGIGFANGGAKLEFSDPLSSSNSSIDYTAISVSIRGAYHFAVTQKLDPYAGLGLLYTNVSSKTSGSFPGLFSPKSGGIGFGVFAGARYYLNDRLGLNAELGYGGLSLVYAGIAYKF